MTIYTVIDLCVCVFEALMIFTFFNAYLGKKEELQEYTYIIGIIILSLLFFISNKLFSLQMLNVFFMILSVYLSSFLFNGKLITRIIIPLVNSLLMAIVEIVVLFSLSVIMQKGITELVDNIQLRLMGMIISKILTFALVKIICTKAKKNPIQYSASYWILFFMIFSTTILSIFLIFKLQYENAVTQMSGLSVISSIGLLFSTFFAMYLYEHMAKQAEIINRQKIFEQQVKEQARYLDEILLSQKQLKRFKHDLNNHIFVLTSYFEENKQKEGLDYLNSIGTMTTLDGFEIETGNTAMDAIINSKKTLAESKGIQFTTHIQVPEALSIEPTDVCIIFGNALDNAIEACDKIKTGDKKISISVIYENDSIICKIVNTSDQKQNLNLKTTKEDWKNHGFGIENIKTALGNYKNVFKTSQTDSEFILSFIIF